jgi:hypothetical protein
MHPAGLRCSSLAYTRHARSSRLAGRAPRRPTWQPYSDPGPYDEEAPLQAAEAFVRQIIGWREFIRGVYWLEGHTYADRNGLDQHGELPPLYWTAETNMACLKACVRQVLDTGFGHHIQRLMVTGEFARISGVRPPAVNDWYLGMFADGVDWVTLPNALGMGMHADRRKGAAKGVTGLVGTKPSAASGTYIQQMSNYCTTCRYDPAERSGPLACPDTVFYWDFLIRTRKTLAQNQRMAMILRLSVAGHPQEPLGRRDDGARHHELRVRHLGSVEGRVELLVTARFILSGQERSHSGRVVQTTVGFWSFACHET